MGKVLLPNCSQYCHGLKSQLIGGDTNKDTLSFARFAELKDRAYRGWISRGSKQVSITISKFKENHNINDFDKVEAYICNKQKPIAITAAITTIQKFKDETGITLRVGRKIRIE